MAATMGMPGDVLAQFDIGLDLPRRDELELLGTGGKLIVPDPWLCRQDHLVLERAGRSERLPVDPSGANGLGDPDHDVYRIELDAISAAIAGSCHPPFGRADAVAQAAALQALRRSAEQGVPVDLASGA